MHLNRESILDAQIKALLAIKIAPNNPKLASRVIYLIGHLENLIWPSKGYAI